MTASREECERRLGRPKRTIAYPYGDYDQRVSRRPRARRVRGGLHAPPPACSRRGCSRPRVGKIYGDDERRG